MDQCIVGNDAECMTVMSAAVSLVSTVESSTSQDSQLRAVNNFVEYITNENSRWERQERLDFQQTMGELFEMVRPRAKEENKAHIISNANKMRKQAGLPAQLTYFHHNPHTNRQKHYAGERKTSTREDNPKKAGVKTMLSDGWDELMIKFKAARYKMDSFNQLTDDEKKTLLVKLTDFYFNRMIESSSKGSHSTYKGPYIWPSVQNWRFIGNRPDIIADAYIRARYLVHWITRQSS